MVKKAVTAGQSLESILWNCRNALRGTVGGNEKNRDAVMGLVFLKFAGDKFDKRREAIQAQHGDVPAFLEKKSFYLSENVFFLSETSRWRDTWRLAKMNLAIRGIAHNLGDRPESAFAEDLNKDKKVDFIMANPPFNLRAEQVHFVCSFPNRGTARVCI
jgi:type I restriction-modification system DNA methylase subunit